MIEGKEIKNQEVKKDYVNQKVEKSEICPVIYFNNTMYINFLGFGIACENRGNIKTPTVKVVYSGEIGNKDFIINNVGIN